MLRGYVDKHACPMRTSVVGSKYSLDPLRNDPHTLSLSFVHPAGQATNLSAGINGSALLPPTKVTSFDLRPSCSSNRTSRASIRVHNLTTPVTIRLPRQRRHTKAPPSGPPVRCRRGAAVTYNITCGTGSKARMVQVRGPLCALSLPP
jgi:hypothetical protein